MKRLPGLLALIFPVFTQAQMLKLEVNGGIANYQGDLQGKRFTLINSKPAFGLGLNYSISNHFSLRGITSYMHIAANDQNNTTATGIAYRNLNFSSRVLEAQLALEFDLFNLQERPFTPYVFAGIAAFHFNPYSFDSSGNKVFLKPLSTEGQGLAAYPDNKPYNTKQIAIPFGAGLKLALSPDIAVAVELNIRKTFTDYLDDVSKNYVDSAILFAAKGPRAVAFAYRGHEIHGAPPYPAAGSQRGNPKIKDWYYTTILRLQFRILGNSGEKGYRSNRALGCPGKVY